MLVGRLGERARIEHLLDEVRSGKSGALVISGEPGIGKTTLLQDTVARAEGMTVLSTTAVPTESDLEYSGLLTIVRPILSLLAEIPEHQALTLGGALGFAPPRERDPFGVGAAVLSLLAAAAEESSVLVVIDDAQWLDRTSADALRFAARRLFADRVAFLVAARDDEEDHFTAAGFEALPVAGLDPNDLTVLLAHFSGTVLPLDVVERLRGTRPMETRWR